MSLQMKLDLLFQIIFLNQRNVKTRRKSFVIVIRIRELRFLRYLEYCDIVY